MRNLAKIAALLIVVGGLFAAYAVVKQVRAAQPSSCGAGSLVTSQIWNPYYAEWNPGGAPAFFSETVTGYLYKLSGCNSYYAYVSGTNPGSTPCPSGDNCDTVSSYVAIWLYNGGGSYLASTSAYVPYNSSATSGATNTVNSSTGIKFKLGWRSDLQQGYCYGPDQYGIENPCTGLYGTYY